MDTELNRMGQFLQGLGTGAIDFGLRLLSALVVLAVCVAAMRVIRRLLKKVLTLKISPRAIPPARIESLTAFVLALYDVVAWFVIAMVTISKLGVDVTSLLTVAGVGGIAIGLGAQTLVKDMLAGLLFFVENQYQPGDVVTVAGVTGEVEKMTLRVTEIREYSGDLHVIPNGEIRAVANSTRSYHRAIVDLSVDYSEPLDRVTRVLNDELEHCFPGIEGLSATPVCLGVTKLADSGVEMRVSAECAVKQHWAVERELRRRIKDRFDAEGIELSLPQIVGARPQLSRTPPRQPGSGHTTKAIAAARRCQPPRFKPGTAAAMRKKPSGSPGTGTKAAARLQSAAAVQAQGRCAYGIQGRRSHAGCRRVSELRKPDLAGRLRHRTHSGRACAHAEHNRIRRRPAGRLSAHTDRRLLFRHDNRAAGAAGLPTPRRR